MRRLRRWAFYVAFLAFCWFVMMPQWQYLAGSLGPGLARSRPFLAAALAGAWGGLWLWTCYGVQEDAHRREWPACWVTLAVFLTWPWGYLAYKLLPKRWWLGREADALPNR